MTRELSRIANIQPALAARSKDSIESFVPERAYPKAVPEFNSAANRRL